MLLIGKSAFGYCSSLESVNIPDSVVAMKECVFYRCENIRLFRGKYATEDGRCLIIGEILNSFAPYGLTEYTIPINVKHIGDDVFSGYDNLKNINIPDGITSIGSGCFNDCDGITEITIPSSINSIGDALFFECNGLKAIYCIPNIPPKCGSRMLYHSPGRIYVPMESLELYRTANGWSDYADAIVGYDF